MDKKFSLEEWKQSKIDKGEWLSKKEYSKKRKREREEEISKKKLRKHGIEVNEEYKIDREVILDTETTGLGYDDKIVEISILELIEGIKTGRKIHFFLNPEKKMSKRAVEIHKITNEKVKNCSVFKEKAEEIIKFIGDSKIVAHNARFDMRMLNNELVNADWEMYPWDRFVDTLEIARYLYPKEKNDQNSLCKRFDIDNLNRVETGIHSALEDTIHLYFIYKNLKKGLTSKNLTPYDYKLK